MTNESLFNETKIILDLCGGTGSWSRPYKDAGYDVRVITLPEHNVIDFIPPDGVYGILSAPPCTEFSPAKGYGEDTNRDFMEGMNIVNACMRIIHTSEPKFWALENPSGFLHRWLFGASLEFQPWYYGDPWTKKTSVWGNFNPPKRKYWKWDDVPKKDLYIRPGRQKPGIAFLHKSSALKCFDHLIEEPQTDAEFRAITPPGFAEAFFVANP